MLMSECQMFQKIIKNLSTFTILIITKKNNKKDKKIKNKQKTLKNKKIQIINDLYDF